MMPFSQIQKPVKRIINDLLSDELIAEPLIYKHFQGQAFSEEEGCNLDTFEDHEITGLRLRHSFRSAAVAQGPVEKGDQFFVFRFEDLPGGISMKDKIVDANEKIYSITAPVDKILDWAVAITVSGS